ncbi:MAG TPA: 4-alpha-glucanotransferase, partial [Pelobium sp.]
IGDLPFYINHDSADVWANPHFFSLLQDGAIYKMAGVPPDYFSADGQLWGMPVYNWEALQKDGFKWWLNRIAKNLEWFNLLRLDHFRAFYNFWEVDASESTAVNGKWNFAPGAELLQLLSKSFPEMPFIAEDLGDVQQEVFKLRDEFSLPGMKVLQFAFGADMPVSPHILHHHSPNFIVYTGTHDNNTTRGWYNQDLSSAGKTRLNRYFSQVVSEEQIAALLIKAAYASVAKIAIIPIQDLLNLGGDCRTNIPGTAKDNWSFKILFDSCNSELASQLRHSVTLYNRNA